MTSLNLGFWKKLRRPFFALAPMEDVTDTVFRKLVAECGKPDVMYTEFMNCEGFCSEGRQEIAHRLEFTPEEKPLVVQIWGTVPEAFFETAKALSTMGFDGIDINMGCPVAKIVKNDACSALIKNPSLAVELIKATKEGAGEIPVSVKTRVGFDKVVTEEWISTLLEAGLAAITVHGRVAAHLSKFPADWDEIRKAVELRSAGGYETLIIGNGDVKSLGDGLDKVERYGVDGVMVGRGIFENPWLFNEKIRIEEVPLHEKLSLMQKHVRMFDEKWGESKNFAILKKFFKIYVSGFPGAAEARAQLMEMKTATEVLAKLEKMV